MSKDEIFDKLAHMIEQYVETKAEDVQPTSRFMEDLGFTSFDFMSLLGEAEEELDIEIDPQEVMDLHTVQEAVDYLAGKIG